MNWYYLFGLAVGALLGTFLIGGAFSWIVQKCFRMLPSRSVDAGVLSALAVAATFTNGSSIRLPIWATAVIFGTSSLVAYLGLGLTRGNREPRESVARQLPSRDNILIQEGWRPAPRRKTPTERTHTVFHRIGAVGSIMALCIGVGMGFVAGINSAWQFIAASVVAAMALYLLSRAVGWIIAGAMPE